MGRMIPTTGTNVRVDNLDPVFAARLDAFLNDPRFGGDLKVFSGVRTYAQQKVLWDGWDARLPGFNLAANPDLPISPRYGLASARGSWHMEQDGRGYAIDLNFDSFCWLYFKLDPGVRANRQKVCGYIESIAREHRLARTVPSEEWHYQMPYHDFTWTPSAGDDDMTEDERAQLAEVYRQLVGKPYKRGQKVPRPIRDAVGDLIDMFVKFLGKLGLKP